MCRNRKEGQKFPETEGKWRMGLLFNSDGVQDTLLPSIATWHIEYFKLRELRNGMCKKDFLTSRSTL